MTDTAISTADLIATIREIDYDETSFSTPIQHTRPGVFDIGGDRGEVLASMPGLSFRTDYAAEQEWGVGDLRKALIGDDWRMNEEAANHIAVCSDRTAFALSARPLEVREFKWGEHVEMCFGDYQAEYRQAWDRWRSRRERFPALSDHDNYAWFDTGRTLVVRADSGPAADTVSYLCQAIGKGSLGLGSASGPFHTGLLIYDSDDETEALINHRRLQQEWHDEQMVALAPIAQQLESEGYRPYFLGKPTEITRYGVTEVRYWLNGEMWVRTDGSRSQCAGWWTLDELRTKAFLEGDK